MGIELNAINILLNIIFFCICGQLATISHEFGHAIPALIFTKDKVRIAFGNTGTKIKKIEFKSLSIEIGTFQPILGFVYWNGDRMRKWQSIICCAGGPFISLIIGIVLIFMSGDINNYLLKKILSWSAYYHIWQFICTAIPIIYPKWWAGYGGHTSDGYNIISIIKET